MEQVIWVFLCIITTAAGFFYGRYVEVNKNPPKKYDSLGEEDLDDQKDLKLYRDEPKDYKYLKEELERERETKRKLTDEYEKEINYLKGLLHKNHANFNAKMVKNI